MYIATTQGLKYNHMLISNSKFQSCRELEKFWDDTWKDEEGMTFEEATEYYGFYIEKIVLNKPFEIN